MDISLIYCYLQQNFYYGHHLFFGKALSAEYENKEVKFTGLMSVDAAARITECEFQHIDISEAEFEEKEVEEYVCLGWSHCGPVYGLSYMRKLNALETIINNIKAKKLVLPATLTRKQLNAVKRNEGIARVSVPTDAKLFSMKDGHLYNKKGTILMFKNKIVEGAE